MTADEVTRSMNHALGQLHVREAEQLLDREAEQFPSGALDRALPQVGS